MKKFLNLFGTGASGIIAVAVCPSCIPALASLVTSLGIWPFFQLKYMQPLAIIAFLIGLFGLIYSWRRHKNFVPLIIGIVSIFWLYVAIFIKFYTILYWQVWFPTLLLIFSSAMNLYFEKTCASCKISAEVGKSNQEKIYE
ncbi:MAG: MerC domain-containing protein [Candidatus Giovannonibacteria bacterium]|nr:MAG: MerC domain-containing protein [Candidatus Giovannonibacteria bacterium]